MITTDKDKNLAPEGQHKHFVIFITLILVYVKITLWLVFLSSALNLKCACKIRIFGKYVKQ